MKKPLSDLHVEIQTRLIEEVRERQLRFEKLVSVLTEIVFQSDHKGSITWTNPAWNQATGYPDSETVGFELSDFVIDEDSAEKLAAAFRDKESILEEVILRVKQGNPRTVVLNARRVDDQWYGSLIDVTDERKMLSALRRSEEKNVKLSMVAAKTDNMVLITDAVGKIEWVNTAFENDTGYHFNEIIGLKPGDFLQGADTCPETVKEMGAAIRKKTGFREEVLNYAKNGDGYWVAIECSPVFNDQGDVVNFISIQRNITEEKEQAEAKEKALESAKLLNEAKSQFIANVSHEIRTPLNAILGVTELLKSTSLDAEQAELLETLDSSGKALLGLINDVLDYSKLSAKKMPILAEEFTLDSPFENVFQILRQTAITRGLYLYLTFEDNVPHWVSGDKKRIEQVLMNLIANALKFTEAGGVEVKVSWMSGEGDESFLMVSVSDTGPGIPSETLPLLFQEFTQQDASISRSHGGSGLGLAIVRSLCEAMNGVVWADSDLGEGSTFSFSIPLVVTSGPQPEMAVSIALPTQQTALMSCVEACAVRGGMTVSHSNKIEADTVELTASGGTSLFNTHLLNGVITPNLLKELIIRDLKKSAVDSEQESLELATSILIVEDSPANQIVLKGMLKKLGYNNIAVASDGVDALQVLDSLDVDVILTDLHMPNMDGFSLTRNIRDRKLGKEPFVIVCSADGSDVAHKKAREAGIDHWLSKPIMRAELTRALDAYDHQASLTTVTH